MNEKLTILIVDDVDLQLELMTRYLASLSGPHLVETVGDGELAWKKLRENPGKYDLVLLDREMPGIGGIELLKLIRSHKLLKTLPVILQTSKDSESEIAEGMRAGAYYYLTKPFSKNLLLSVVETALRERLQHNELVRALDDTDRSIRFVKEVVFEFKSIDEAYLIASVAAKFCKSPSDVVTGISELLINAVEHGNLGISYDEKSELKKADEQRSEISRRLKMPMYSNRVVTLKIKQCDNGVEFLVADQGDGFDWEPYLDFDTDRILDNHGRGIAMANKFSFSKVEYQGKGNIVLAYIEEKSE